MNLFGTTIGVGVIMALILLGFFWPFVIIWSLNTLFPALLIPYTFWTWLSMLIVSATFGPKMRVVNKQ